MRQRVTIILTFVVIVGVLVIINTLTHGHDEPTGDVEFAPNRSTYHSGPTGTRALHDFLNESGYSVMRWREPTARLLSESGSRVQTLVIVGETRMPFDDDDYGILRYWVAGGGRLVMIDRSPGRLLLSPDGWAITTLNRAFPNLDTNPGDVSQMTKDVRELKPVQPTLLTSNVESVMPSLFASRFAITAVPKPSPEVDLPEAENARSSPERTETNATEQAQQKEQGEEEPYVLPVAPVVHIGDGEGALLLDYAYEEGRIILLTDPFIVTNTGIRLKDNLALAINLVGGPKTSDLIAFEEYHHGRGIAQNPFASYFAGTPVLPIAGQILLLVLVVLWTNGRRFGRALPLPQVDRRSSLEFVTSMAELQERSRAFDLAIENIYSRTRRVLARHAGVDYNSSRTEIAERIAARSAIDRHELETLMRECEEAINGEPINSRQSISLVRRLREIERALGLRMRSRDVRQAAENI